LANWGKLRDKLRTINWWDIFLEDDLSDIDVLWNKFKSTIFDCIEGCVPFCTTASIDKRCRLSDRVRKAKRTKRVAYRVYRRHRNVENRTNYRLAVSALKSALRASEMRRERNLIRNSNSSKFFKFLNSKLKHKPRIEAIYDSNGLVTSDPAIITERFSEYFKSVFSPAEPLPDFPEQPHARTDFYITRSDVRKAISDCPGKYSSGCDGIPSVLYKQCCDELCLPLQVIFTVSLSSGKLPNDWLTSAATPIHKKGSRLLTANYRPVSLTVTACRILERIIKQYLVDFIFSHRLISSDQHGFLPQRSTLTNLLLFVDKISRNLDAGLCTNTIYLDIAKAFDKIPHSSIIQKLSDIDVDIKVARWIKNFLIQRNQYVMIGDWK
jgi:hypothetical protein